MTVALDTVKKLQKEIEQLKGKNEVLGEGIHLITMSHMYVQQKSELYEKIIKNITKKDCLGAHFNDIKSNLNNKDLEMFDFIITKYIQGDQDMFNLVNETSHDLIENITRRLEEFAAANKYN